MEYKNVYTSGLSTGRQMEFRWRQEESSTGTRCEIERTYWGGTPSKNKPILSLSTSEALQLYRFLKFSLNKS